MTRNLVKYLTRIGSNLTTLYIQMNQLSSFLTKSNQIFDKIQLIGFFEIPITHYSSRKQM